MAQAQLAASPRDVKGKGPSRAVRRAGLTPGIIYGGGEDNVMISLDPRLIIKGLSSGHFFNTVYEIVIDGGKKEKALARDVQMHPVSDQPLHVDFMRVTAGSKINVMIPVVFINEDECPGLRTGGILQTVREEVEMIAPADAIPENITVDLSGIEIGETIRFSVAKVSGEAKPVISDRDFVLATIQAPRAVAAADEEEQQTDEESTSEDESEE